MMLYIHIPFCKQKCAYCAFCSGKYPESFHQRYIDRLCQMMDFYLKDKIISTVYIGGGTPSVLSLALWEKLLMKGGAIHFKTDNRGLFEFSLNSFSDYGMRLRNITLDLHASDFEGNVMTEYETLFSQKGNPIYRCEAMFDKNCC